MNAFGSEKAGSRLGFAYLCWVSWIEGFSLVEQVRILSLGLVFGVGAGEVGLWRTLVSLAGMRGPHGFGGGEGSRGWVGRG